MTKKEEVLELYKVMVGTITSSEQRRQQLGAVFLTLIAAGITALGAIKDLDPIYVAVPGLIVSVIWFASVSYFRRLAQAKFKVIEELEKHFSIRPFELERTFFKNPRDAGSGGGKQRRSLRLGLTQLEMIVPGALMLVSGAYVLYRLIKIAW